MSADFLSNIVSTMEQTQAELDFLVNKNEPIEKVIKINPDDIGNWEFRDRQDFELGDIESLSESILLKGQAQPIIVVESNDLFKSSNGQEFKYIVIAGYRRWLACKLKNIFVEAIVRKLNFEQAILCLVSENEKEKVSDYSKGFFYFNLLKKERVIKKTLYERLGINRCIFDNYLSFAEVPKEIWVAIKDVSNVSARTASTIKSICQRGEKEKKAILMIADKIALGIGEKKINTLVNKILSDEDIKTEKNATRVAFAKNIYMDVKEDSLMVVIKKINKEDTQILKEKIGKILENFFNETK